jgi:hypothetical protein
VIQAGLETLQAEIHKAIHSTCNKEEQPEQQKESIILRVYKKGDKTDCSNYWGISFLPTSYKMLSNNLLSRLSPCVGETTGDHQCGFRHNRSTTNQIFCIRQILEKKWEYTETVHQLITHFKKANDSVRRKYFKILSLSFGYS